MMKRYVVSLILLMLLFSSGILFSQADSVNNFILPNLKITQTEKGKLVTYSFTKDFHFFRLSSDTLRADTSQYFYRVALSDIYKIGLKSEVEKKASVSSGILVGLIAGCTAGLIEAAVGEGRQKGWDILLVTAGVGTLAAVVGAIITGSEGQEDFETFSFRQKDPAEKKQAILNVLKKYNFENK